MPIKSKQQLKFMGMCAKNPETAKGDCPPKSVAQEFLDAPRPKKLPEKKKVDEGVADFAKKAAYGTGKMLYNTSKFAVRKGLKGALMGGAALARGGSNLIGKLARGGAEKADKALKENPKMGFAKKIALKAGSKIGGDIAKHTDKLSGGISKHLDPRVAAAKEKYAGLIEPAKKVGGVFTKDFWNYESLEADYPNLMSLLEYRVRKPSELAKLRQDARNERKAYKKGKMTKRQKDRYEARKNVLKADAEEDYIYSRDFRESLQSAIDSLILENKKNNDENKKNNDDAYGSAETHDYHSADQADVQAMLDKHPSNPANKPKKKRKKTHYGNIRTPQGDVLDMDHPSDSGRY